MSFARYSLYRDSGAEWLGEVPAHWDTARLKRAVSLVTTKGSDGGRQVGLENVESWTGRPVETEAIFGGEGVEFCPGDLLFGKLRPYLAKVWHATFRGEAVGDFFVLRPSATLLPRYAQHVLLSRGFIEVVDGSTFGSKMPRASWDFMGSLHIPVPPLVEQETILAFLDRETAKLDALVAEQQRLIVLLRERYELLILRTINGQDSGSGAEHTPTGIEWPTLMPAGWEATRLGRKIELQRGVDITKDAQVDGNVPVVSSGGVGSFHNVPLVRGPGVVVGRKGSAGSLHYVESDFWPHDTTLYVRNFGGNDPRFVYFKLRSMNLRSFDTGSSNPTLNRNLIHPTVVVWPPREEQERIAAQLELEGDAMNALVSACERAIALLQERRAALISAAVTGQVNVLASDIAEEPVAA